MLAITLTAPPPCSQISISILNTRFNRCAHVIDTWRAGAGWLAVSASRRPRLAGVHLFTPSVVRRKEPVVMREAVARGMESGALHYMAWQLKRIGDD